MIAPTFKTYTGATSGESSFSLLRGGLMKRQIWLCPKEESAQGILAEIDTENFYARFGSMRFNANGLLSEKKSFSTRCMMHGDFEKNYNAPSEYNNASMEVDGSPEWGANAFGKLSSKIQYTTILKV